MRKIISGDYMRRIFYFLCITAIVIALFSAMITVDKNSKEVAGFLDSNTVFKIENGVITILNEEISLK